MARFPRTLGDAIAAQAEAARSTRTSVMGVDPLAPISLEQLDNSLQQDLANNSTELENLNGELTSLAGEINTLDDDLSTLQGDLAAASEELASVASGVDTKISTAISDAMAQPLTDDRFTGASLSIWPFIDGAIPQGALAPGSVGTSDIADFALTVKKIKSDRHHLY